MAAVFLEQRVLASVAASSGGIGEVLRAVDLDGELEMGAIQIHFHLASAIEGDSQLRIQAEQAGCF